MKTILILFGGKSEEHEISLISAKCILDALDRKKFTPLLVGISRQGSWHFEDESNFFVGDFRADKIKLNTAAPTVTLAPFCDEQGRGHLLCEGKTYAFDVVFPILHGPFGEDGTMQGLWDIVNVPYVGSHCGSSWICMDKALAKALCKEADIPTAPHVLIHSTADLTSQAAAIGKLGYPLFVKPSRMGSSVGVSKVTEEAGLFLAVKKALSHDTKVLIEKGIDGREIECAVLGLHGSAKVAAPGEIIPNPKIGWYSYEGKYLLADGAETVVPAHLTPEQTAMVQKMALRVFDAMECDGMARVDLFLERKTGKLYLNEVNTIPGFTPISMYPKMWQASGLSYPALITQLIELAVQRKNPA